MRYVFTLIILFNGLLIYSQQWDGSETWLYEQSTSFLPVEGDAYFKLEIDGDTIINGLLCHKVQGEYILLKNDGSLETRSGWRYFVSYADGIMLKYDEALDSFITIYDFNLLSGDTLKSIDIYSKKAAVSVVDSVSKITVNGLDKRIQYLSHVQGDNPYSFNINGMVVEDVGSPIFLFGASPSADPSPGGQLICFQNSSFSYPDDSSCQEASKLNLSSLDDIELQNLKIFPNPVKEDFLQIDLGGQHHISHLYIVDLCGKTLFSKDHPTDGLVDISFLSPGSFLIMGYLSSGNYFAEKIIRL